MQNNAATRAPQASDTCKISGIVPPLVTPLSARDELDHDGLSRLLEHIIQGGVSGVFILGTTGEAPSLSYRLRRELITETVRIVNRRVPFSSASPTLRLLSLSNLPNTLRTRVPTRPSSRRPTTSPPGKRS